MVSFGVVTVFLISFYLKFKFDEINAKIEFSLKNFNTRLLMSAINEHNFVTHLTSAVNHTLKYLLFNINFIGAPAVQTAVYLCHSKETDFNIRILLIAVTFIVYLVIFSPALLSTLIARSARKSCPLMYSLL